jgi:hypothetical protein
MAAATGVSLAEYLHTDYEPVCDYVDGVLQDRNVGQQDHGETQASVAAFFIRLKKRLKIRVATELRMQVSATRVNNDRLNTRLKIISDHLTFGVPTTWIIDPRENPVPQQDPELRWNDAVVQLSEILPE